MSNKIVNIYPRAHEGGVNNVANIFDESSNYLGNILIGFCHHNSLEVMIDTKDKIKMIKIDIEPFMYDFLNEHLGDFGMELKSEN